MIEYFLFERNLLLAYGRFVYYEKIIFLVPSIQTGKQLIDQNSRSMEEWLPDSPIKDIVFKYIPRSLLQKTITKSNTKDKKSGWNFGIQVKLWNS